MTEDLFTQSIQELNSLKVREDVTHAVKSRVFKAIDAQASGIIVTSVPSPLNTFSLSSSSLWTVGTAFALVLVLANQLPMHSAYHRSITNLVVAGQIADALDQSENPITTAHEIKRATADARATLDTLNLKGQWGMYSQSDCLHAYILYDRYLDYLQEVLAKKIPETKDGEVASALTELDLFIKDSRAEAQSRIKMYPEQK